MTESDVAVMNTVLVGEPDTEIVALEARLRAAQLAADVSALDALIADELLFTGPDGSVGTKEQDLAAHRSGAVRFRAHEPEELRVRRVGADVAVTALRARLVVAERQPADDRGRIALLTEIGRASCRERV